MRVKEAMSGTFSRLLISNSLLEAAEYLNAVSSDFVPVTSEDNKLVGIFTKHTLLNAIKSGKAMSTPLEVVIERDMNYVFEDDDVKVIFDKKEDKSLVVDSGRRLVGILSKAELLRIYYKEVQYNSSNLNVILESTTNAIIAIDINNCITVFNKAARELLEITDNDVIGRNISEVIEDSTLPYVAQSGNGEVKRLMSANGNTLVVNRQPIIDNGQVIGAISIFQDVTYYEEITKQLEDEKHLTEILQTILDIAYDGILVVDKEAKITMISRSYATFLGVDKEKVIGKHVTEVVENTRMHKVLESGQPEIAQMHKINGSYMIATRIPIFKNGVTVGVVGKVIFRNLDELNSLYNNISKMEKELEQYRGELKQLNKASYSFENIIGKSREIQEIKALSQKAAHTDSSVLILGESGTGKEFFAHAIHKASKRAHGPFIKVNCAAIPNELLESELFGYEVGAFTGARKEGKPGKFELADGGTIFLDEIGDMPLNMQVKLLRVLQEREIEKIGGSRPKPIDVRIIAATNQSLEPMINEGKFRSDLYYRLNEIKINIPALRERKGDVVTLSYYLLDKVCNKLGKYIRDISSEALEHLKNYQWPGNVRELENVIERAVNVIEGEDTIGANHLPKEIVGEVFVKEVKPLDQILNEAERQAIADALILSRGNKTRAAQLLNISRTSMYEKMAKHNIFEG
jgi:PAS domain S-box-containing protein